MDDSFLFLEIKKIYIFLYKNLKCPQFIILYFSVCLDTTYCTENNKKNIFLLRFINEFIVHRFNGMSPKQCNKGRT